MAAAPRIHPTALIDPQAQLAEDVEVGPYSVIGPRVTIGARTRIGAHAVIDGLTVIGSDNSIASQVALGGPPQDKKYAGEETRLVIGDHNTIREFCTFNTGTAQDQSETRVGSHNWIMAYVHIAHDCVVGNHCILANNAQLAGHVKVDDWAILGGMSGAHQFVRVGAHSMSGGGAILLQDLPPYVICQGNPAAPHGLNSEGLKRRGFSAEAVSVLKRAYRFIYREGLTAAEAVAAMTQLAIEHPQSAEHIDRLRRFVQESQRGILR